MATICSILKEFDKKFVVFNNIPKLNEEVDDIIIRGKKEIVAFLISSIRKVVEGCPDVEYEVIPTTGTAVPSIRSQWKSNLIKEIDEYEK